MGSTRQGMARPERLHAKCWHGGILQREKRVWRSPLFNGGGCAERNCDHEWEPIWCKLSGGDRVGVNCQRVCKAADTAECLEVNRTSANHSGSKRHQRGRCV